MNNTHIDKIFLNKEKEYYDTKYIIVIVYKILNKFIEDIILEVQNSNIQYSRKQIISYLKQNDINSNEAYYAIEYYDKYITILKAKILKLLDIILKVGNNKTKKIEKILKDLDINICNNSISKEDIIRLITPLVYNLNELNIKLNEANNLEEYKNFKLSKKYIENIGYFEDEIYPSKSLQIKSLDADYHKGNIKLSINQKKELKKEYYMNMHKLITKINKDKEKYEKNCNRCK